MPIRPDMMNQMVDDRIFKRADDLERELGTHPILITNVDLGSLLSAFEYMASMEYETAQSFIKETEDKERYATEIKEAEEIMVEASVMQTKIDYIRNVSYAKTIHDMTSSCDPGLPLDLLREEPEREEVSLRDMMHGVFEIPKKKEKKKKDVQAESEQNPVPKKKKKPTVGEVVDSQKHVP